MCVSSVESDVYVGNMPVRDSAFSTVGEKKEFSFWFPPHIS